jgi:hypothetical protein
VLEAGYRLGGSACRPPRRLRVWVGIKVRGRVEMRVRVRVRVRVSTPAGHQGGCSMGTWQATQ